MKVSKTVKLFDDEIAAYQEAIGYLEREILQEDELIKKFSDLLSKYSRLISTARRLCSISDVQSKNLKKRESEIKNLLDHSDQGFLTFKKDLLVDKEYSYECTRIFNREIANLSILELLHSENGAQNKLFADALLTVFDLPDMDSKLSCLSTLPNLIKISENFINIKYKIINTDDNEEDSVRLMLILTDITEKRKVEDQVLFLSYHDKLTSLFNRAYVESVIPQLQIESNLPFSIIMVDLNALKVVNDVFGHQNGDKLIVNAAKVFLNCCRKSDIIARWGGDEFLIMLPGANPEACERICNTIKAKFDSLPADPVELSASLGAATIENWDTDIPSLIGVADSVMYANKLIERKKTKERIFSSIEKVLQGKCSDYIGDHERAEAVALRFAKLLNIGLE
ncbi:MAG: GGDEF domain-containing protein [Bacillota bacterium]|nr:GGDEF domain-containing protein [Bacillota bacterium]